MRINKLLRTMAGKKGDIQAEAEKDAIKGVKGKEVKKTCRTASSERKTTRSCKTVILAVLFATSVSVAAAGIVLIVLSLINKTSFTVFQSQIPASVFGLIVTFLGIRYYLSVLRLKPVLLKDENQFSWKNFRKESHT